MSGEENVSQSDLQIMLRAVLAEFQLELLKELVTKAEHESLVARHERLAAQVATIEVHGSPQAQEQGKAIAVIGAAVERNIAWRNKMAGAITVLAFFAAAASPVIFNHYF